jgi:uncharacterized protein YggU (UPF0235/DUF167 family)
MAAIRPWRAHGAGLVLAVRVTPRGGRDAIDGVAELANGTAVLKLRVRVAAEDGAANRAVIRLLADGLRIPARAIAIRSGETARLKQLVINGDAAEIAARLEAAFLSSGE